MSMSLFDSKDMNPGLDFQTTGQTDRQAIDNPI